MRSLFLKIFLWFWGAMILIGVALFLVVTTTQADPIPAPWRESTGNALAAYATAAAATWEQGGRKGLGAYLENQERLTDSQYQFFDVRGNELSGHILLPPGQPSRGNRRNGGRPGDSRPGGGRHDGNSPLNNPPFPNGAPRPAGVPPPNGVAPPPQAPPPPFDRGGRHDDEPLGPRPGRPFGNLPFLNPGPPPEPPEVSYEEWESLRAEALHKDRAVFAVRGPDVMAVQAVRTNSGKQYVLQALMRRPRFGRPAADPVMQVSGVLVVLLTSGLVCYGLVRYLTSPIVALRLATRQLANGDLSARTGAHSRARRDEVADLGRDFDTMAERIEILVTSQQRLLGDISHELRSPLARLTVGLALARRYVAADAEPEQIEGAFDRIKRETGRLNFLIEQLLQLTRLESGGAGAGKGTVELDRLVQEIVDDTNFEIEGSQSVSDRSVVLTASCACKINGSPDLLTSAVENVVRNAMRYTHPGTRVEVSLTCEPPNGDAPETAVIQVRDHGDGVPPEALTELFRPFYRVEDARDRESGGVGLGLAITERAVRFHGGTVAAYNASGGGLLVELRLPIEPLNSLDKPPAKVDAQDSQKI